MTLQEAIQRLWHLKRYPDLNLAIEDKQAILMGIKASIRVRDNRRYSVPLIHELLAGETKE